MRDEGARQVSNPGGGLWIVTNAGKMVGIVVAHGVCAWRSLIRGGPTPGALHRKMAERSRDRRPHLALVEVTDDIHVYLHVVRQGAFICTLSDKAAGANSWGPLTWGRRKRSPRS